MKQRVNELNASNNNKSSNSLKLNKSNSQNKQNNNSKDASNKSQTSKKGNESSSSGSGAKKKAKYVNLYSQDGAMADVVLLKGRRLCNCQASKHKLINNCLRCGRIVCEQEGSGPCLFCGNIVCTEEEQRTIESSTNSGKSLKETLSKLERPVGWEEAVALRNRLLDYDRMGEKRTTVIDDESDYFRTNSVWLNDDERAKLQKLKEKFDEKKHSSRRNQKMTIDFSGRQIIEEPLISNEFEDEILKEIAQSVSTSTHTQHHKSIISDYSDLCNPNLSFPPPVVSYLICFSLRFSSKQLGFCFFFCALVR